MAWGPSVIISDEETWIRCSGIGGSSSSSHAFLHCVLELALIDLGLNGPQFTWNHRRSRRIFSRVRLDRALGTSNWVVLFPNSSLRTVAASALDHCPSTLNTVGEQSTRFKPFRFEAMWCRDVWSHWVVRKLGILSTIQSIMSKWLEELDNRERP